ncbi:MAG: hypothetical protein ACLPX7_06200 [Xanthobacteraceae bacterium]
MLVVVVPVLVVDVFEVEVLPVVVVVFEPALVVAVFEVEVLTVPGVLVVREPVLVPDTAG